MQILLDKESDEEPVAGPSGLQHRLQESKQVHANGSPLAPRKTVVAACDSDVVGQPWYFGSVPRTQCDTLLNEFAEDGDFLVRASETNGGDFSISLKAAGRNKHFRVHFEDGVYCIGQRRFPSMTELIQHYKKAPIYTSPKGEKLYLVKPFARQK